MFCRIILFYINCNNAVMMKKFRLSGKMLRSESVQLYFLMRIAVDDYQACECFDIIYGQSWKLKIMKL